MATLQHSQTNQRVAERLSKIATSLEEVRDGLFECSRECIADEQAEWTAADALFALAKSADELRRQIKAHLDRRPEEAPSPKNFEADRSFLPTEKLLSKQSARKRKEDYPKYVVRSGCLLKIGLSRDKKSEYEHEVSRAQFDKIITALAALAETKKEFTVDELQGRLDCPSYQTYIVVAVCAQAGLLESPWRGTYILPAGKKIASAAAALWSQLPTIQPSGNRLSTK
jgi:hypothetical protein